MKTLYRAIFLIDGIVSNTKDFDTNEDRMTWIIEQEEIVTKLDPSCPYEYKLETIEEIPVIQASIYGDSDN